MGRMTNPSGTTTTSDIRIQRADRPEGARRRSQAALHLAVLGSGSKGNCAVISGPDGAIMVDAGFSKRETLRRLATCGIDPASIKALLVTHEHSDHIKGLGVVSRGLGLPVYASLGTADVASVRKQVPDLVAMRDDDELVLAGIRVKAFPTSHDAADPVGFRFDCAGDAIGYATDTGYLTGEAAEALADVRLLALEANHDPKMLASGPYPYPLKQRIASDRGHLSNEQSAEALDALLCDRLEAVVAMHLSETNNEHRLPVDGLGTTVARASHPAQVLAAWQRTPTVLE